VFVLPRPRVTISIIAPNHALDQELLNLDLPPGLTILDLKAFVNAETDFPQEQQQFYLNNAVLQPDSKTLEEAGVKDDDMLVLLTRPPQQQQQTQRQPQQQQQNNMGAQQRQQGSPASIETTRLNILGNAAAMAQVREQRPALAEAINDSNRFREVWLEMMRDDERREGDRMEQMRLLNDDPFNVDAQRKIEEMIRQQSVQDNLQHAYEHNPEGEFPYGSECPCILTNFTSNQSLVALPCSTSTSKLTATQSKPSWIPAPKQPSCHLHVPKNVASCV
jgi:DNA damage-inducible protein 1